MGDQSWSRIHIGGTLRAQNWRKLAECLQDDFFEGSTHWRDEFDTRLNDALEGRSTTMTFDGMCAWGNPDTTMAFCVEHGLPYQRSWDAGGGYDRGCAFWKPGMDDEVATEADADGDVVIRLDDLKGALAVGQTLAEVIAAKASFEEEIPVLTLTFTPTGPGLLQPAGSREGEELRLWAGFHLFETRVRSLTGEFEGTGLVIAKGICGRADGQQIMVEIRLGTDSLGKHVECETCNLEIVNG